MEEEDGPTSQKYSIPFSDSHHFAGIEFPGPVTSTSRAIKAIGGLDHVSTALLQQQQPLYSDNNNNNEDQHQLNTNNASSATIELNLDPSNRFHHPVPAHIFDSGNIILKVTRRKRKRPRLSEDGETVLEEGVVMVEPIGVATKTVRFRSMADYQFNPQVSQDPILDLVDSIKSMDVEAIQNFSFPPPDENFTEDMYLPPPTFSRVTVPQIYDYKPSPTSVPITATRPSTGEEYTRLINSNRWKGRPMITIAFSSPSSDIPGGPNAELIKLRKAVTDDTERELAECFEMRKVWTRTALLNNVSIEAKRMASNHKHLCSLVGYTFSDGPFRDLIIKWGYDPRVDPEARFYQHITLRNITSNRAKKNESKMKDLATGKEHLFDGVSLHTKIGNFQLIDITDPLVTSLIHSPTGVLQECTDDVEGWYDRDYFEQMRNVVRRKFLGILKGVEVRDEDCKDLLGDPKLVGTATGGGGGGGGGGRPRAGSVSSIASSGGGDGEGSGSEGAAAGSGSDTNTGKAGRDKSGKRRYKKPPKAYWEGGRKKKVPQAKKPAREETEEERADRLRAMLGLQQGQSVGTSAGAGGSSGGGGGSDAEEDASMMEV
ncbi:hypothetical protein T439DRAFT_376745 [Meredithblackwellia eburnea MCA 4105]